MSRMIGRVIASSAALAATGATCIALAAPPASADKVNNWYDTCNGWTTSGCLYDSRSGGGRIMPSSDYIGDLTYYHYTSGTGSVRNSSKSIGSNSSNCGATTWVYTWARGPFDWVSSGRGGNLTSTLTNNNASFWGAASCQ